MLRRRLLPFVGSLALSSVASLHAAHATTAVLPSGSALPLDQHIAVSVSPSRTTIWTNLHLDTAAAPVALVVPVPPGAALDHSSDAWLEALDDATAPRIFPPSGVAYVCPGTSPDPAADPFHVTTDTGAISSIAPTESKVLADLPAVAAWANANGFSLSLVTTNALKNMTGMRFFVERFYPQTERFFTSTLRVVLPNSNPVLPLVLSQAGAVDLRITAWFMGTGRPTLTGSSPLKLQTTDLQWLAQSQASNYVDVRDKALLAAGSTAVVTETASHDGLVKNIAIANGQGSIPSVVSGYFQRAAKYFEGNSDTSPCLLDAGMALDSTLTVSNACPRADLGVVDGTPTCVESPTGSEVDPAKLRCGGRTDDLALALSNLQPSSTWITRVTMLIPKESSGQTWPLTFTAVAPQVDPTETASSISFAGCGGSNASSSSSSGSMSSGVTSGGPGATSSGSFGNGTGGNTTYDSYDDDMACGCVGPASTPIIVGDYGGSGGSGYGGYGGYDGYGGGYNGGYAGSGGDIYYDDTSSDSCSGSTTDSSYSDSSSSDSCSGSTTDSTYNDSTYSDTSSSDDCSGSTTDSTYTDSTYSDTSSSDDCGGSTTDTSTTSDSSTDWTDTSTDSSDSSDSSDCTVARKMPAKRHKRGPKTSALALGLIAILAPLRRLSRPRRKAGRVRDKLGAKRVR